ARTAPFLQAQEKSAANGRKLDFDAAVLGAAGLCGIRRDRRGLALALDIEAALIDALIGQNGGNGHSAALAERKIVSVVALAVGVAIDIDDGLVEFLED